MEATTNEVTASLARKNSPMNQIRHGPAQVCDRWGRDHLLEPNPNAKISDKEMRRGANASKKGMKQWTVTKRDVTSAAWCCRCSKTTSYLLRDNMLRGR